MKIVKYVLIGISSLIVLIVIVGLLAPNVFKVEKSITINAPKTEVYPHIAQQKLQNEWSVWAQMDSNQKVTFEGVDGTPGSKYSWEGEITGKGSQELVSVSSDQIKFNLIFTDPYESQADVYFNLEENGTRTVVTWGFDSEMPFPMNIFTLFGDMGVGDDFQKGLENLKVKVEE